MRIFSKNKFIEVSGREKYLKSKTWVDECDGKEVINGWVNGYSIDKTWEIEGGSANKRFNEMTIHDKIKRIGSLNNIDQAVRLVGVLGGTVCGYDGLIVSTIEAGALEFEERGGRVWLI